jgi:hypothetical protein
VLVVGVTSWPGEGVEPKSLEMVFDPMKVLTLVTIALLSLL